VTVRESRIAFEAWWRKAYHPAALQETEAGCYLDRSAGLAWDAWQAKPVNLSAAARLMIVAAELLSPNPLRKLHQLPEMRALVAALDDAVEKLRLLAIETRSALDEL
jgi:hypothetical protein